MEAIALQNLFYQAIYERDPASIEKLSQHIKPPKNLTPVESLAVYRGNVIGTLSQTLMSTYSVCTELVGEKFFEAMAVKFIDRFPCFSPNLGDYGPEFPDFLATFDPVAHLPYLPDVARLEWHWSRVFGGEDTKPLDFQRLGEIPQEKWGELILYLPKNSVLLESAYPIHRIWQVNQPDYHGDDLVSLEEGGIKIFLWRKDYDMHMDLPTEQEWELLKAFQGKERFELVCEKLADRLDVGSLLPLFVQRGWIADFSLAGFTQNP